MGLQRWATLNPAHARRTLSREWEHQIKRDFDGDPKKTYSINLLSINEEDAIQLNA